MSHQTRDVPKLVKVCDLCDEEINEEQAAKTSSLAHGYGGSPEREKATAWYLLWHPADWPGFGRPTWEQQKDEKRWGHRHYDFHTECLLHVVEAAMKSGPVERPYR